jgi:hypothetical protein
MKRILITALLPRAFAGGSGEQGTMASQSKLIVIITNQRTVLFRGIPVQAPPCGAY